MMLETWKMQRPLYTTETTEMVLIYNVGHSAEGQIPMTKALRELFGEEYKIYVLGEIQASGEIKIDRVLSHHEQPDW